VELAEYYSLTVQPLHSIAIGHMTDTQRIALLAEIKDMQADCLAMNVESERYDR
jgi:hypothetical protein